MIYKFSIQKYFYVAAFALFAAIMPAFAQTNPNLVKNSGFESGAANWKIPEDTAKVVSDVARSGAHSLYYSNKDEKRYKMFSQNVDAKPGQRLRFSVWLKGQDITGKEGAGIYMQSADGAKYIGGSFPRTPKGTFDWQQILGEYTVPANATTVSIGLYLRKGVTGSVWFDDVEVHLVKPAALASFLQFPNYRGLVTKNNNTPWKFQVQINKQPNWKNAPIKITNILTDHNGKVLFRQTHEAAATDKNTEVTLTPPGNLALGDYILKQTISDPNGSVELENQHPIRVVEKMPKVYIDPQGFTVVNGKRFFPLGLYGSASETDMKRISEGGFNTLLVYGYGNGKDPEAYLDRAAKHQLKVVYSLKDMYPGKHNYGEEALNVATNYVKTLRDKSALLAWYTNDELDTSWLPKLHQTYEMVKKEDPNHPAFQVLYQMDILEKYFDVTDILGTDPYPVGSANLTKTSTDTRLTIAATHGANGVWMVPQIMDWAVYKKENEQHPPSLDEMRNQAYQAIINGATGLIFYQYHDLMFEKYPRDDTTKNMDLFHRRWKDVATMAEEVNNVIPTILADQKVVLDLPTKSDVEVAAWAQGNQLSLLFANPYYETNAITFELPNGWKVKDATQGQIKSTFANGKTTFTLPPVGSGVFQLVKN